ncbi:MAG: autotransporter-associated beta strand repeat-containing protein [Xanthobacteraceae bacterium]
MGLGWSTAANAADLQWSADGVTPGGGGTANWNTAAPARWYNGIAFQTWNNAALDNAIFGGTAGTVTINAPVTAHNLVFSTSGYTVTRTGGANFLTLGGVNPTIDVLSGGSATIISPIAGSAGLTKTGDGTLTLSGTNTYTGGTTINAGTLSVNSDAKLGNTAGGITFNGGTLQSTASFTSNRDVTVGAGGGAFDTSSGTLTLGGLIAGTGALTKSGAGTLRLIADSPGFTGTTTISAGTLQLGNNSTAGSIAGDIVNNGTLVIDRSNDLIYGGVISGSGVLTKNRANTLTLTGNNTYQGQTNLTGGTLEAGATNAFSANSAHVLSSGTTLDLNGFDQTIGSLANSGGGSNRIVTNSSAIAAILTTGGNNTSTTFAGVIQDGTGTVSLTKEGAGTFTLSGANTYSGVTLVNAGTLRAATANDFSANSAHTVAAGAFLDLFGGSQVIGSLAGAGTVINSSASATARTLTTGGDNASTTFSGVIQNGANAVTNLIKQGTGVFTLSGANTYSGTTTINAGTLQGGATNAFSSASAHTVAAGALLDLGGFSQIIASLAGAGTVTNSGGAVSLTTGGNNTSTTFSGVIQDGAGATSLTKTGTGTFILTGDNTYTGGTTISAGTLQLGSNSTTGSIVGDIVNNGTLVIDRSNDLIYGGVISGSGVLTKNRANTLTLTGNNTYQGQTNLTGGTLRAGATNAFSANSAHVLSANTTLDLNGFDQTIGSLASTGGGSGRIVTNSSAIAATLTTGGNNTSTTFTGMIQDGAGTVSLIKEGTGTFTLSGADTYSGATLVNAGTLSAATANDFSANSAHTVAAGAFLDLFGGSQIIGSLAGAGTVINSNASATARTLTTGGDNASTLFSGVIQDGANAVTNLIKQGAGTFTLSGPTPIPAPPRSAPEHWR